MADERHKVFVACYLFLKKGSEVLLLRRYNTGYQDGNYTMVSGHIEEGESAIAAMKREAMEEAGIDINPHNLRVVHVEERKGADREYVDFYLTASEWRGEPKNMEPNKCDDLGWFEIDKLPKNIIGYIPIVIKKIENGEIYSEYFERQ
jgi:8-oxo-dGTP pyrophosphatase MutT (NUDIX family)